MEIAVVTGSAGLIGAESVRFLAEHGVKSVGIDNDMRRYFFGNDASTEWQRRQLEETVPGYVHYADRHSRRERDLPHLRRVRQRHPPGRARGGPALARLGREGPAHRLHGQRQRHAVLLEAARQHCPDAVFIFISTNKVYGDNPNSLPLVEQETRWEVDASHPYHAHGIDEAMSIDDTKHSLFGASKLAADVIVQEYGSYFGMKTGIFRGGCLTGPGHSGTQLHGFLAYLMKCAITGAPYTVFGYKGKQVRDNIHSRDLVNMFWHFYRNPRPGQVYNAGGSRFSNCSMAEAIALCDGSRAGG